MKRFLVIGNPIKHSLSPMLHNYWIKNYNISGIYEKKKLNENNLENIISQIKKKKLLALMLPFHLKKQLFLLLTN